MFFLPIAFWSIILFILFLPILLIMGFFHILFVGFENLGISSATTVIILLMMLLGSTINIPLTKTRVVKVQESSFFGLIRKPKLRMEGVAINVGGAIIPILLSIYFLFQVPLESVIITTILMIFLTNSLARPIPNRGIGISIFLPVLASVGFSFIFASGFVAPCAFISGVLGTLIGVDILNLRKIQKMEIGFLCIGGVGVFDGIFLIGIVAALLAGF